MAPLYGCALTNGGNVSCWGYEVGAWGDGSPNPAGGYSRGDAVGFAISHDRGCAILNAGHATCWGANQYGQSAGYTSLNKPSREVAEAKAPTAPAPALQLLFETGPGGTSGLLTYSRPTGASIEAAAWNALKRSIATPGALEAAQLTESFAPLLTGAGIPRESVKLHAVEQDGQAIVVLSGDAPYPLDRWTFNNLDLREGDSLSVRVTDGVTLVHADPIPDGAREEDGADFVSWVGPRRIDALTLDFGPVDLALSRHGTDVVVRNAGVVGVAEARVVASTEDGESEVARGRMLAPGASVRVTIATSAAITASAGGLAPDATPDDNGAPAKVVQAPLSPSQAGARTSGPAPWMLLGTLALVALVLGRRRGGRGTFAGAVALVVITTSLSPLAVAPGDREAWPMFGGGPSRGDGQQSPSSGALIWKFEAGGVSGLAVRDATVFVQSDAGVVFALNASTGELVWKRVVGDAGYTGALLSPAVAGGVVFAGTASGEMTAIAADTGALLWTYAAGGPISSAPIVADGAAFFGSSDGYLYSVDADSGVLRWKKPVVSGGPREIAVVYEPMAVWNDLLFYAYFYSDTAHVFAVDVTSGERRWSHHEYANIPSASPIVDRGVLYLGIAYIGTYVPRHQGTLLAIDGASGELKWRFSEAAGAASTPASTGRMVYFGSADRHVYGLSEDGSLRWRFQTGDSVRSALTTNAEFIHVGSSDGRIHALRAERGEPAWNYSTGGPVHSLTVVGGLVYASAGRDVYALGDAREVPAAPLTVDGGVPPVSNDNEASVALLAPEAPIRLGEPTTLRARVIHPEAATRIFVALHDAVSGAGLKIGVVDPSGTVEWTWTPTRAGEHRLVAYMEGEASNEIAVQVEPARARSADETEMSANGWRSCGGGGRPYELSVQPPATVTNSATGDMLVKLRSLCADEIGPVTLRVEPSDPDVKVSAASGYFSRAGAMLPGTSSPGQVWHSGGVDTRFPIRITPTTDVKSGSYLARVVVSGPFGANGETKEDAQWVTLHYQEDPRASAIEVRPRLEAAPGALDAPSSASLRHLAQRLVLSGDFGPGVSGVVPADGTRLVTDITYRDHQAGSYILQRTIVPLKADVTRPLVLGNEPSIAGAVVVTETPITLPPTSDPIATTQLVFDVPAGALPPNGLAYMATAKLLHASSRVPAGSGSGSPTLVAAITDAAPPGENWFRATVDAVALGVRAGDPVLVAVPFSRDARAISAWLRTDAPQGVSAYLWGCGSALIDRTNSPHPDRGLGFVDRSEQRIKNLGGITTVDGEVLCTSSIATGVKTGGLLLYANPQGKPLNILVARVNGMDLTTGMLSGLDSRARDQGFDIITTVADAMPVVGTSLGNNLRIVGAVKTIADFAKIDKPHGAAGKFYDGVGIGELRRAWNIR